MRGGINVLENWGMVRAECGGVFLDRGRSADIRIGEGRELQVKSVSKYVYIVSSCAKTVFCISGTASVDIGPRRQRRKVDIRYAMMSYLSK